MASPQLLLIIKPNFWACVKVKVDERICKLLYNRSALDQEIDNITALVDLLESGRILGYLNMCRHTPVLCGTGLVV